MQNKSVSQAFNPKYVIICAALTSFLGLDSCFFFCLFLNDVWLCELLFILKPSDTHFARCSSAKEFQCIFNGHTNGAQQGFYNKMPTHTPPSIQIVRLSGIQIFCWNKRKKKSKPRFHLFLHNLLNKEQTKKKK